jgi:hypothetical protein
MYWATAFLFIGPGSILFFAWRRLVRAGILLRLPTWRKRLVQAALLIGEAATLLNIVWNVSWLYNGGSPHGGPTGPGIWQSVGPFLVWTFVIATVLGVAFGKGLSRLFFAGWSFSMFLAFYMIYMLQFD